MKKICFVTGTRADFGLLSSLMHAIKGETQFELQIVATGMHLSPEFGLTYTEIEKEGLNINEKVEMLLSSDTNTGIIKSTGLGMIGFADAINRLSPDLVILLGDRFETFAAATAAYLSKIPIAHLHGGEVTEGATDEALRHSITKMAFWHLTSTENYKRRVIQLGETPDRVFNVGALGIDNIKKADFFTKDELSESLGFNLDETFAIVTYHPVTLENNTAEEQFINLLKAISSFENLNVVFTKPNADANGRVIVNLIDAFVKKNTRKYAGFTSLGSKRYLSLMKLSSLVIGNSSSGIIETPAFGIPTVNIGDRQKGRDRAESVINAQVSTKDIVNAIDKGLSEGFQSKCRTVENVYGMGDSTQKIIDILNEKVFGESVNLKKTFYDL